MTEVSLGARFPGGVAPLQEARKRALESPRTKARNDLTQLQSRFHGPGARVAFATGRISPRLLVESALPQPDRLGHLLSWARDGSGWIGRSRRARAWARACYESTHRARLRGARRDLGTIRSHGPSGSPARFTRAVSQRQRSLARTSPRSRAASRAPPRRGARSAAPKVPSVGGPSNSGWGFVHRLSPACGLPPAPLQSALEPLPLTGSRKRGLGPPFSLAGQWPATWKGDRSAPSDFCDQ